jgi:hypothetical protein
MSLESKGRLVDAGTLNLKLPQKEITRRWVKLFKSIPEGKAFVSTDKELGVSHVSVRSKLTEFQQKGWAAKGLRVSYRHRKDGVYDIYIIHEVVKAGDEKGGPK